MILKSPLYYCSDCKKVVPGLDSLLFVEDHSNKGFCSEDCIESFYRPIAIYFEQQVLRLKEKFPNLKSDFDVDEDDVNVLNNILNSPDEVWLSKNELDEEIYTYIKKFKSVWFIILCLKFKSEPSYILLSETTNDVKFLNEFKSGELLKNPAKVQYADDEEAEKIQLLQDLDQLKSEILAEHLVIRTDVDIAFENFQEYDFCIEETITKPDEIFEYKNKLGMTILHYLKSFVAKNNSNFYYIVIALKKSTEIEGENDVYPVFTFPTRDDKLFMLYRKGERLNSILKN